MSNPSPLLAWMRLFRIPNVFTAVADVAMGFVFVHATMRPPGPLFLLAVASSFLYLAGMVLNDVYDIEVDREERPHRPLPAGQISLSLATFTGYGLLALGVAAAAVAGLLNGSDLVRPASIAGALAVCVVLYDRVLKKTPLGPAAMGACRFFNVLLGMSLAGPVQQLDNLYGFGRHQLLVAGGIGIYITGVTVFARTEAKTSSRGQLIGGVLIMLVGIAMLGMFPDQWPHHRTFNLNPLGWPLLLALLAVTIVRRCMNAVLNPIPETIQPAVKSCIFSLIIFDAAICLMVGYGLGWGAIVLALLLPTYLLGQWVYST